MTRQGNPLRVDRLGDEVCVTEWVPGGIVHHASWTGFAPRFWPDQAPMSLATRRLWRSARTLADLGDLTARWLEGQIDAWPGYGGGVDVDHAPGLTAALVAANRAGIVTTGSQAGHLDTRTGQCAWLDGFTTETTWHALEAALGTRYRVVRHTRRSGVVPVTWVDGQPVTGTAWMPRRVIRGEIYPGVGPGAVAEVLAAVQVAVIDPEPGSNTLWPDLLTGLARMHSGQGGAR